jgi:hypothetical protein
MMFETLCRARIVATRLGFTCVIATLGTLSGCQEEQGITQYAVPRQSAVSDPEHAWYIKLEGSPEAVEPLKDEFESFVASVEVGKTDDGAPLWQLPEGWSETEPASSVIYKAFEAGEGGVKCTVTVLPVSGGAVNSLHGNYNRWLGQVSRPEVAGVNWLIDAQAAGEYEAIEGAAGEVAVFDLRTEEDADEPKRIVTAVVYQESGAAPVSEMPLATGDMPAGHPPIGEGTLPPTASGDPGELPMTFAAPDHWVAGTPNTGFGQMRIWTVDVEGEEVTVAISHTGGDLTQNILRWAGQAGVEITTDDELRAVVERILVDDQDAASVNIPGPEKCVGGVILASTSARGYFWFFKINGPTAAVAKFRPEFDAFIETVDFVE